MPNLAAKAEGFAVGALDWIEAAVRRIGSHRWFMWAMSVFWAGSVVGLYFWPQPPGVAVAFLCVGTIFMTFREMTATHKLLWFVFAMAMFGLEWRAIWKEHSDNQASLEQHFQDILKDNRDKTKIILNDNQTRFAVTAGSLSSLGQLSTRNLEAANQTLNTVTGGNGFLYVEPVMLAMDNGVHLRLWNMGKYTLNDVTFSILGTAGLVDGSTLSFTAGSMLPHQWSSVPAALLDEIVANGKPVDGVGANYWVLLSAQNAMYSERLEFRDVQGEWQYEFKVYHVKLPTTALTPDDPHYNDKLVFERPWTTIPRAADATSTH
jgi:hypothetical protein